MGSLLVRLDAVESMEQLKDVYSHFMLYSKMTFLPCGKQRRKESKLKAIQLMGKPTLLYQSRKCQPNEIFIPFVDMQVMFRLKLRNQRVVKQRQFNAILV